ncbi:MAG: PD-(D/E)XK nuclease family protein, partial [bacterium]|nr:PD-(D/E)XK nuclease family protein [bacterium]
GVDADQVYPGMDPGETVLVQGIIDAYFEEDGELVVVDYKTDRVTTGEELVGRYRMQLDYYAQALEQLTGKHVKEKLIYSFALRREIEVL